MSDKPFIKLLRSPNSGYFFDVNRNEIVAVDEGGYDYLIKVENDELAFDCECKPKSIQTLEEQGYFSTNKVREIKHPYTDYLPLFLSRKVKSITLQVTQSCNLRCKYCIYSESDNSQQRIHSQKKMTFKTAQKAIDFLLEHSIDSDNVNIAFYGGEPLLEFSLLKKSVLYAKTVFAGKDLTFSMTTNATLISREILDFLSQHQFALMFSMDGPKEIHDANRVFAKSGKGSYDTVIEKLQLVREEYPDYLKHVFINMVIDPQNDFDCINSIVLDCNMLAHTNFNTSMLDKIYSGEETKYSMQYSEKLEYSFFTAYLAYIRHANVDALSIMSLQKVLQINDEVQKRASTNSLGEVNAPSGPCIPGQLRPFVNADENLFPCERVSELSDVMKIGSLDAGYDIEKVANLLNVSSISKDECRDCWAFTYCGSCARYADQQNGFSKEFRLQHCDAMRNNTSEKLKTLILIQESRQYY